MGRWDLPCLSVSKDGTKKLINYTALGTGDVTSLAFRIQLIQVAKTGWKSMDGNSMADFIATIMPVMEMHLHTPDWNEKMSLHPKLIETHFWFRKFINKNG